MSSKPKCITARVVETTVKNFTEGLGHERLRQIKKTDSV